MNAPQGFPAGVPEFGMRGSDSVFTDGQHRMVQGIYVNHDLSEDRSSICLLQSQDGRRLVSWGNGNWHGAWHFLADPPSLVINFDCQAREDRLKPTVVCRKPGGLWVGPDYRGRRCSITWTSAMFYDGTAWHDLYVGAPPAQAPAVEDAPPEPPPQAPPP